MSFKKIDTNFRLIVEPSSFVERTLDENYIRRICDQIKSDIERHAEEVGSVIIEWDEMYICTECNCIHEEKPETEWCVYCANARRINDD